MNLGVMRIKVTFLLLGSLLLFSTGFIPKEINDFRLLKSDTTKFDDGPYVFIEGNKLVEHRIVAGNLVTSVKRAEREDIEFEIANDIFLGVSKIAALSDIHGQYDLMIRLFQANGIIGENKEWSYGDGHLVIVGDVFDRGADVVKVQWFIYELEKQAIADGGMVHYILGNHEYMVMQGDLRYLHPNHIKAAEIMNTTYDQLFGKQTQLGRWLRSKPTILKIDDNIFVHGGFSESFLMDWKGIRYANDEYRSTIEMKKDSIKADPVLSKYAGSNCPIWYRGYFDNSMTFEDVDMQLNQLEATRLIVGHTSQKTITELYEGKIYCVDSSIKNGRYGELLLIENGEVTRGNLNGDRLSFEN